MAGDASRRVLIVASGLRSASGHNLGYTRAVDDALRAQGHGVEVAVNRNVSPRLLEDRRYQPVFTLGSYDFPPRLGPWASLAYLHAQSVVMALELRAALKARSPRYDLVFCHTLSEMEILAWRRLVCWSGFGDGQLVHLLRRTPGYRRAPRWKLLLHPYWQLVPSSLRAIRRRLGSRYTLLTDSSLLTDDYRSIYGGPVATAPIPLDPDLAIRPRREVPSLPVRIGYLGDSRPAKGFGLLPFIVRQVLSNAGADVRFVIQCLQNQDAPGPPPSEFGELRKAAEDDGGGVSLIEGELGREEYLAVLRSLDLVVLPYTDPHFREGTSNIFAEATAVGVPTVVPVGSWMAAEAGAWGGCVTSRLEGEAFARATLQAVRNLESLTAAARTAAGPWRAQHSPGALARLLITTCAPR